MISVRRDLRKFNEQCEDGGPIERLARIFRTAIRFRMLTEPSALRRRPTGSQEPRSVRGAKRDLSDVRTRADRTALSAPPLPCRMLDLRMSEPGRWKPRGSRTLAKRSSDRRRLLRREGSARTSALGSRMLRLRRIVRHSVSDGHGEGSTEAFRLMIHY